MKRFRITYRNADDPGSPHFVMSIKAYDREHAETKFWDSDPNDTDWTIVSVKEVAA